MNFTLRQLEIFLTITKAGSITQAAKYLNLSQSAVSSALKDLEKQFDFLLFDRVGKRLQLNEIGKKLRPRAESLLAQAQDLEQSIASTNELNQLKIGATLTIANSLALPMISDYLKRFNNAPISLEIDNTQEVVKQVLNFEIEMGMIEGETHEPQLSVTHWRDDHLKLFCNPKHPLACKEIITDEDLLSAKWILREPGSGTRQTFDRAMHGLLPRLNVTLVLSDAEAIKRAVKHSIGISCLSTLSLDDELKRGEIVQIDIPKRDFNRKFYLIMHKQKHITRSLQNWLNLCEIWGKDSSH